MKLAKLILLILIFIISSNQLIKAQNAYYYALEIADSLAMNNKLSQESVVLLGSKYLGIDLNASEDWDAYKLEFQTRIQDQPFLNVLTNFDIDDSDFRSDQNLELGLLDEIISGSLGITTIADGFSQFLIQRAQDELTVAYFGRFRDVFEKQPEIKILFPTTSEYILAFETYQYASMINALRDAFLEDLNNMPENMGELSKLDIDPYNTFFNKQIEGVLFLMGLDIINSVIDGDNAADILNQIGSSGYPVFDNRSLSTDDESSLNVIKNYLGFSARISESLRSMESGKIWISSEEIKRLTGDKTAFNIYMGLLYIELEDKQLGEVVIQEKLADFVDRVDELINYYDRLLFAMDRLNRANTDIEVLIAENKTIDFQTIHKYATATSQLLVELRVFSSKFGGTDFDDINSKLKTFEGYLNTGLSVYENLQQKKYTAAIIDASVLVKEININDSTSAQVKEFRQKLLKYGTFISLIAEADSAKEVKQAIEAVVLPAGSYRIKRTSKTSSEINAYLGGFGGFEWLDSDDKPKGSFGVWAPVGISFSTGHYKYDAVTGRYKEYGSHSLFISVIDIGAFTSVRLESETESIPEFQLKNIVAPGLFYVYGVKNSPISLFAGAQYGPQVREVGNGLEESAYRVLGGFAVDIPLFHLRTRPRK